MLVVSIGPDEIMIVVKIFKGSKRISRKSHDGGQLGDTATGARDLIHSTR